MTKPKATLTHVRSLARVHSETAIETIANIMRHPDADLHVRLLAANSLLDRGWGKPGLPKGEGEVRIQISEIVRTIVDPNPLATIDAEFEQRMIEAGKGRPALIEDKTGELPDPEESEAE